MSIRDKAEAFVEELNNKGFNGVQFSTAEISSCNKEQAIKDGLSDGMSQEWAEEWANDYVCISLYPEMDDLGSNDYNCFDSEKFEFDLRKHTIETFGKECLSDEEQFFSLDLWGGEFEVYDRKKYKEVWRPRLNLLRG